MNFARRLSFAAFAFACAFAFPISASAQSTPGMTTIPIPKSISIPNGPPAGSCDNDDPGGVIDFRGHVGKFGGVSFVQIFSSSDDAQAYVSNLVTQLGGPQTSKSLHASTPDELQASMARMAQWQQMIATAPRAALLHGDFACSGFAPGRYIFLAQVQGGGRPAGDSKAILSFYRADVDVTSVHRRATVVVSGFHRIASYPPAN